MVSFNPFPNYDTEVIFSVRQSRYIHCAIRMSRREDFTFENDILFFQPYFEKRIPLATFINVLYFLQQH